MTKKKDAPLVLYRLKRTLVPVSSVPVPQAAPEPVKKKRGGKK